ncbi:MAG: hypothetical protein M3O30_07850 [Planctomycetota bacterium]|nr:hypothetical protein [Planctomycetota bacterium]
MMRLPRIVPALTLACLLSGSFFSPQLFAADDATAVPAPASVPAPTATPAPDAADATTQPAPAPADPAAGLNLAPSAPPSDILKLLSNPGATPGQSAVQTPPLVDQVDTYMHYGKVARYDLASAAADKILAASSDPSAVLSAFETVAARNHDSIDGLMLKWQQIPLPSDDQVSLSPDMKGQRAEMDRMRTVTAKLRDVINLGYATRSGSPDYIRTTIVEMSTGERAYDNNLPRLQRSGELAVKVLVDILRSPADRQYNNTARRILRDLGKKAVAPLVAATEMKTFDSLVDVCAVLGDLGYDAAVPYLARLSGAPATPEAVKIAARNALIHMGVSNPEGLNAAALFNDLAEKLYYNTASITPSPEKISYIWYWDEGSGLVKLEVPSSIFDDVMAMRAAEYAMKLDPARGQAVSLWLAANTKREADLPRGASDPTHKGDPDAHYYNVSAGVQFLNDALARSIHDRNAAVTLKLTQSLQDIIGQREMTGGAGDPLIQALYFPNRLVRYEAAFALAESLPSRPFPGSDRVVPVLVEALGQSSKPNVLVLAQTNDLGNIRDAVASLGYQVASAAEPTEATNAAMALSSVDVIIASEDSDVQRMIDLAQTTARLQGASFLVLTHLSSSPYAARAATDSLLNTAMMPTKPNLAATLKSEIDRARQHAGTGAVSDQQASGYALRAADLLVKLALTRGQALDMSVAEGGVLTALSDSRVDIAKAAGRVLATLDSPSAQNGLAAKASDEATPADVRVSLFKSLANNAKFFGNRLDPDQVSALEKIVISSKNADIRGAAAEARGALNLPADQARTLIINQSRV